MRIQTINNTFIVQITNLTIDGIPLAEKNTNNITFKTVQFVI